MDTIIRRESTDKRTKGTKKGQPHEQPRVAIQRMRDVVGVYLYMKEKNVSQIFIDQVDRIDAQIENIENALEKSPRTAVRKSNEPKPDGKFEKRTVTFNKWVPQKLKEKWLAYMDDL